MYLMSQAALAPPFHFWPCRTIYVLAVPVTRIQITICTHRASHFQMHVSKPNDCKYIDDDMWKVWEVFIFFLGSATFPPKCLMNPLAANRYPDFLGMKISAFTLE